MATAQSILFLLGTLASVGAIGLQEEAEEELPQRTTELAKIRDRDVLGAWTVEHAGADPQHPEKKQCILAEQPHCSGEEQWQLHRNLMSYATFNGYNLKYVNSTSTGRGASCFNFFTRVEAVLAAMSDGCDLVLCMGPNVLLTNIGMQLHQLLDNKEDALFLDTNREHRKYEKRAGELDQIFFVARNRKKVKAALSSWLQSQSCLARADRSPWNETAVRLVSGGGAAAIMGTPLKRANLLDFRKPQPSQFTWKTGSFAVELTKCGDAAKFLEEVQENTTAHAAFQLIEDVY